MAASANDLTITQGVTLRRIFAWREPDNDDGTPGNPISLGGYDVIMQFRQRAGGTLIDDWAPYIEVEPLDTNDQPLVGELHLRIGADVTAGYTRGGLYELRLIDAGDATEVVELLSGKVFITKEIATDE